MARRKLTPKRAAFVREYLVDLNAAAAARRAGYSEKTSDRTGYELLRNPEIAVAVAEAQRERARRTGVRSDQVIEALAAIAFAKLSDFIRQQDDGSITVELAGLSDAQLLALKSVQVDGALEGGEGPRRVQIRLHDKLRALELLGKHLGLFVERRHLTLGKDPKDMSTEELREMLQAAGLL